MGGRPVDCWPGYDNVASQLISTHACNQTLRNSRTALHQFRRRSRRRETSSRSSSSFRCSCCNTTLVLRRRIPTRATPSTGRSSLAESASGLTQKRSVKSISLVTSLGGGHALSRSPCSLVFSVQISLRDAEALTLLLIVSSLLHCLYLLCSRLSSFMQP